MKKSFHPYSHPVLFTCSSCQASYSLLSTLEQDQVSIEVCSNCHPFYLGKTNVVRVSGKSQKLISKFDKGKQVANKEVLLTSNKAKAVKQTKRKQLLSDVGS